VGLDAGTAATDYIQLWNGSAGMLTDSFSCVYNASVRILRVLEPDSAATGTKESMVSQIPAQ